MVQQREIFLHEERVKLFSALCVVFILFIIVLKVKVNHNAFTKFFSL